MRILVFGFSRQRIGGIETFLLNMNEHMDPDCIFDYVMLAGSTPEDKCLCEDRIHARGGRIHYVTSYSRNPMKYLIDTFHTMRHFKSEFQSENGMQGKPVAYINLFSMVHITPLLMAKLLGYRLILHSHNNEMPQTNLVYRLLHKINRALFGGMKATRIMISDPARVFMFGKKRDADLIYNAIDPEKFRYDEEVRRAVRNELGVGEGTLVIGFSGRLARQKNPLFLVDVFEQVHRLKPDSILIIAGDGELREAVVERIKEKGLEQFIRLLGMRKDMERLYQAMDVFLLPSLFEGLGIVLIEAQAAGLYCVASADVIPNLVQVSEGAVHFLSLSSPCRDWAQEVIRVATVHERISVNNDIVRSRFNILSEAHQLQEILFCGEGNK